MPYRRTFAIACALVPLLPYLLKAGEKAAEETGKAVGSQSLEWAKSIWSKLQRKVEAKPIALEDKPRSLDRSRVE